VVSCSSCRDRGPAAGVSPAIIFVSGLIWFSSSSLIWIMLRYLRNQVAANFFCRCASDSSLFDLYLMFIQV
jgi:hypothetical protein